MPRPYTLADIVAARQAYVDGVPTEEILARVKISAGTFYKGLRGELPGIKLEPIPLRRPNIRRTRPSRARRKDLVGRLWRTAEQQVGEIEARIKRAGLAPTDSERDARALAVLVKVLRELSAIESADKPAPVQPKADSENDDVRDIDDYRRDLARKIDAIVAARNPDTGGAA